MFSTLQSSSAPLIPTLYLMLGLKTGSVTGVYTSTFFCMCEKGVGSLSLCLRFSAETQASLSQRRTGIFLMDGLSPINATPPPSGTKCELHALKCSGVKFDVWLWMDCAVCFSLPVQPDESPFVNGKITHTIKVVPTANLTVACTVSNEFGMDIRTINVSSRK